MKQLCLQVDSAYAGERIDKYLAEVMNDYSRSFLQKQLKDGNVSVNEKTAKASLKVAEDDEVRIFIPEIKNRILYRRISPLIFSMKTSSFW